MKAGFGRLGEEASLPKEVSRAGSQGLDGIPELPIRTLHQPFFSPWNTFSLFSPPKHQPISVVWATLVYLSYFLLPATFSAFASYMSLSRIPLPSIAFVLTADHSSLPSRPSVIKFEFDPLKTIHPTSSGRRRKLDPVGVHIGDQTDKPRAVEERFFFHIVNDSDHPEHESLDDEPDARTTFAEQRPTTSRGPKSKGLTKDAVLKHNLRAMASTIRRASTIRNILFQFKPQGSVIKTVVDEE